MTRRPARTESTWRSAALLALAVLGGAACSTAFEPQQETGVYFSLSGYLEAGADTHWVRVGPLRRTADPIPAPLDADVALERPATGERWPFRDSLFTFADGYTVRNVWTTAPVAAGETYRVVVRRRDGAETRATVRVPPQPAPPEVVDGVFSCPTRVVVRGVERVVDAYAVYRDRETGAVRRFSKLGSLRPGRDGATIVEVFFGDDAAELGADPVDVRAFDASVVVAVGTGDWPDLVGLPFDETILPRTIGVENGVGFVGGVVTVAVPFVPGWGNSPPPGGTPEPCLGP